MDCGIVVRNEVAEKYLRGELSPAEQDAYEQHFFECEHCFEELQSLQAIQGVLREAPPGMPATLTKPVWKPWWGWVLAGAVAASLVAAVLLRQSGAREPVAGLESPGLATTSMPSAAPNATGGTPGTDVAQVPATITGSEPSSSASPPGTRHPSVAQRGEVLAHLARVDPPRYSASALRGPTDEATLRFHDGMNAYSAGDYAVAVQKLRNAAALDPGRPDIAFFLGASQLLSGDTTGAAKELKRTIALGDTPFVEEAHFYLAKAYLKQGDAEQARAQLAAVTKLHGRRGSEAGEMLAQLAALPSE